MRPRIVALLSAIGTLLFVVCWIAPTLPNTASLWWPSILQRLPMLALAGVILYAVLVLLLTTAIVLMDLSRIRSRISNLVPRSLDACRAIFAETALNRMAERVLDIVPVEAASFEKKIARQGRFGPGKARQWIVARLYRSSLTRAQFFTALGTLVVIAALGSLQNRADLIVITEGVIPVRPILGAIMALAMLAAFGWFVVYAAAEPLLDTIAQLPPTRPVVTSELVEPTPIERILELPTSALTVDGSSIHEVTRQLSENSITLAATVAELKFVVTELTATIERLSDTVQQTLASPALRASEKGPSQRSVLPGEHLGRELRNLLKEFD